MADVGYENAVMGAGQRMANIGHYANGQYRPGGARGTGVGHQRSIQIHADTARERHARETVWDMVARHNLSPEARDKLYRKELAETQVKGWAEAMGGASYAEYHRHLKHINENVDKWGLDMPHLPPAPPAPPPPPPPAPRPPPHQPAPYDPGNLRGMSLAKAQKEIKDIETRARTYGMRNATSIRLDNLRIYEAMVRTGNHTP